MEVFATFDILNAAGVRIAEGHKASFCLEDNTCLPGVERKYSCKNYGDQGMRHLMGQTPILLPT
jgi:lysyl oxidase-like protein 2/3/4